MLQLTLHRAYVQVRLEIADERQSRGAAAGTAADSATPIMTKGTATVFMVNIFVPQRERGGELLSAEAFGGVKLRRGSKSRRFS